MSPARILKRSQKAIIWFTYFKINGCLFQGAPQHNITFLRHSFSCVFPPPPPVSFPFTLSLPVIALSSQPVFCFLLFVCVSFMFGRTTFQRAQYPAELEKLIVDLHSSLGVSLGLPQSSTDVHKQFWNFALHNFHHPFPGWMLCCFFRLALSISILLPWRHFNCLLRNTCAIVICLSYHFFLVLGCASTLPVRLTTSSRFVCSADYHLCRHTFNTTWNYILEWEISDSVIQIG